MHLLNGVDSFWVEVGSGGGVWERISNLGLEGEFPTWPCGTCAPWVLAPASMCDVTSFELHRRSAAALARGLYVIMIERNPSSEEVWIWRVYVSNMSYNLPVLS